MAPAPAPSHPTIGSTSANCSGCDGDGDDDERGDESGGSAIEALQQTIHRMTQPEGAGCVHPVHGHSFQAAAAAPATAPQLLLDGLSSLWWSSSSFKHQHRQQQQQPQQQHHCKRSTTSNNNNCVACGKSLSRWSSSMKNKTGSDENEKNDSVVQCVACGVRAHRSCAMLTTTTTSATTTRLSASKSKSKKISWNGRECPGHASPTITAPDDSEDATINEAEEQEEETISFEQQEEKSVWNDENTTDILRNSEIMQQQQQQQQQRDGEDDENKMTARRRIRIRPLPQFVSAVNDDAPTLGPSFASVAKALQENVLRSFNHSSPLRERNRSKQKVKNQRQRQRAAAFPGARHTARKSTTHTTTATAAHNIPIIHTQEREGDVFWNSVKSKVNVGVVAGAIAGGAAGLALAGPAGAYVGYMAAGSVLAEGAVAGAAALTVVAAGIATGTVTGHQINERIEERVLTMGEEGVSQKVLLVRPNIHLDPVWNRIMKDARRSFRGRAAVRSNDADADIVMTQEDEIATSDKVLLLVSRMLNDRTSLSGHVYRYLMETFVDRAHERERLCQSNASIAAVSPRARRDDAHAVIKHVTASLLEERQELGSSSFLTEVAANAVEGLVFGHLYDSVYEEIVWETQELDAGLWRKITLLQAAHRGTATTPTTTMLSSRALTALQMLPEAHSAADKLHFGVQFLDRVSEHFAKSTARSVCADSLLRMVCQHMVWAENQGGLNSQIGFLEEFARDEQLLRGREGYALVTLQASLHFLNLSTDLQQDIFAEDSTEEDDGDVEDDEDSEGLEVEPNVAAVAEADVPKVKHEIPSTVLSDLRDDTSYHLDLEASVTESSFDSFQSCQSK